jgi:hypothetical protein
MTGTSGDDGLEFLREDQRESGLTIAEYERKFGVILGAGDRAMGMAGEIRRHETFLHESVDRLGAEPHCRLCAPHERPDEEVASPRRRDWED